MYILNVRGLTKHFGGIRAIEDVSFRIRSGSVTSIIGPNGAGKTTLFNCLTGITRPSRGTVVFGDTNITDMPPHAVVRLGIARTFQNIRLFREMTVLDNALVPQHMRLRSGLLGAVLRSGRFRAEERSAREKALEYLDMVGLAGAADTLAMNLPYGAQKRLEIARALATGPSLLLLDEPTAGMNPQETAEIMGIIARLRKLGKSVILIEHDMKIVMGVSEEIVVLDHGVKIAEGTPDEIRSNPLVIDAYLGG